MQTSQTKLECFNRIYMRTKTENVRRHIFTYCAPHLYAVVSVRYEYYKDTNDAVFFQMFLNNIVEQKASSLAKVLFKSFCPFINGSQAKM